MQNLENFNDKIL